MPVGVGGGSTRVLRGEGIAAWVETVAERTVPPTIDRVKAHDAVTETALMSGTTPLPARFGQTFDSDEACLAALDAQAPRLLADLEGVRDLVEMRVVIALPVGSEEAGGEGAGGPGLAYMRRLLNIRAQEKGAQRVAEAVREEVRAIVGPLIRREEYALRGTPAILTISHLVRRADASAYRAALNGATLATRVRRLVVRGPGAPYQFVSPPA